MDMELSQRLQELRKREGYSQEQLAELLGISRQSVSKWENGQTSPDIHNVRKLSELYQVTTDYIICGREAQTVPQEKGFRKIYDMPRAFRIALAVCITAIVVGVVVPVLFLLALELVSYIM